MGFSNLQSGGGGGLGRGVMAHHHNFTIITPMIMKSGKSKKIDVFYTVVTKNF